MWSEEGDKVWGIRSEHSPSDRWVLKDLAFGDLGPTLAQNESVPW